MTILYGIPNCDTVKKARRWLDANDIDYRFHDLRKDGLDVARLRAWVKAVGWERLLNTRGTTWRGLPESERRDIDAARAVKLMHAHPALIKRPVLETAGGTHVGFSAEEYRQLFT